MKNRKDCIEPPQWTLLKTLQQLGSIVHSIKSAFQPSIKIQYLGVIIDSEAMTVTLTPGRANSLKACCIQLIIITIIIIIIIIMNNFSIALCPVKKNRAQRA